METNQIAGLAAVALTALGVYCIVKAKQKIDRDIDEMTLDTLVKASESTRTFKYRQPVTDSAVFDNDTGKLIGYIKN